MNRFSVGLLGLSLFAFVGCGDVTNPGGDDDADAFVPIPDPTISSVNPERGPLTGGTTVTLTGTGFLDNDAGANMVIVGSFVANDIQVASDSELTFDTPAGLAPGSVAITVFNSSGFVMTNASFTYNALPVVTGIDIDTGMVAGGLEVTVTGTGFSAFEAGTNTVDIGGTPGVGVSVNSDTELSFDTGVHSGAMFVFLELTVSNANGSATLNEAFRYLKPGLLAAKNSRFVFDSVDLYYIDPATADTVSLGRIGGQALRRGITGMEQVGDGRLYAATTRNLDVCCDRTLIIIDPLALDTFTPIGPLLSSTTGSETGVIDLAMVNGTLYGATRDDQRIVTINPTNGQYTTVGAAPMAPCCVNGTAFAATGNGALWWLRSPSDTLSTINVSNSVPTVVTTLQGSGSRFGGAAMFGGTLYGVTLEPPSMLMSINPVNGFVQEIGQVPSYLDALVATPW